MQNEKKWEWGGNARDGLEPSPRQGVHLVLSPMPKNLHQRQWELHPFSNCRWNAAQGSKTFLSKQGVFVDSPSFNDCYIVLVQAPETNKAQATATSCNCFWLHNSPHLCIWLTCKTLALSDFHGYSCSGPKSQCSPDAFLQLTWNGSWCFCSFISAAFALPNISDGC